MTSSVAETDNQETTCIGCDVKNETIQTRQFDWYCTPKAKYREAPYWTKLEVELCADCYQRTANCTSVTGHDWWDAVDHLTYTYLSHPQFKANYDAQMAKFFGFETTEALLEQREQNRKTWELTKPTSEVWTTR